jgi:phosphatidylinositol alpha-mannosyltransferase
VRVALLCPYSVSRPGGVQGQVLGLARALLSAGHEATVLAPSDMAVALPGLAPDSLVTLGGTVSLPANGSMAPVALNPSAAVRAVRAVRHGAFDVLHLHEPLAPGPGYACLVACAQPKVGTFHRSGSSAAYRALGPLARWAARRLAARCAVSAQAQATARQALGGSYDIVGNGVELGRFVGAQPWPTLGPTVLFVGRHEERKGLGVLLDAVDLLDPETPVTVWVAGEGPETEQLRRRHPASARLAWLGPLDDGELASRLAGAHVLCAPSLRGESFGVVLLEAMAARAAIVASDLPGYASVLGGHGVLVPPGDPKALAGELAHAVADAAGGAGRSAPAALEAAFQHAGQWSMAQLAARYVEIYERVLAGHRAPY